MEKQGVVAMIADKTTGNEAADELLDQLGANAIPYYAIFPADNPNKPILLHGIVTQGQFLEALRKAGPTKLHSGAVATAPREQK